MLLALSILACAAPCDLASTIPGYTPQCDGAVMARYPDETRVVVLGAQAGSLVAYLPARVREQAYGGTSGEPLTVVVDTEKADRVAVEPEALLRILELGPDTATVELVVAFEDGEIQGEVELIVESRD